MFDCSDVPGETDSVTRSRSSRAGEDAQPEGNRRPDGSSTSTDGANAGDATTEDPRLSTSFTRCLPGDGEQGTVLLVGVVHDHPASLFRVSHLLSVLSPDIVALELPPLAMPLFAAYGRDEHVPPGMGGEMSVALQSANDVRTVGIDAPNMAYIWRLGKRLRADRPSRSVLRRIGRDLVRGSVHALVCRLGAILASRTPILPRLYVPLAHGTSLFDSPADQAADEQTLFAGSRTLLEITDGPTWTDIIDEVRDETMAEKIAAHRTEGDVLVVVGLSHLDPLTACLEALENREGV